MQKFYVSSKEDKEYCRKTTLLTSDNLAAMSALNRKNQTTNPIGYKLGELTEINKALLFCSGKKRVQT